MQGSVFVVVLLAVYIAPVLPESLDHRFPFYNTELSWEARVNDLVGRLTLDEIQDQLSKGGGSSHGGPAPGIDRLGIKHYQWWTGCNRGVVWAGEATDFPQAIGIAASFDPNLRYRVAEATAEELSVKHVQAMQQGTQDGHHGLSCFSPNVDVVLHPYWGRAQETHGECPYLGRVYADQFVRGLQGNHSRYIRANAGCKHFAVHAGPDQQHGNGPARNSFNAEVSMYDMRMTFLPAFRQCVESGTYSIMSSYNAINGVPVAANKWLLTDLLRTEWGFNGYVLADAGAIENLWWSFHYTNNAVDTVAASIKAGMNIETYNGQGTPFFEHIVEAIHQGKLTESMVRERVKPLFYTRMRLGEFDPPHLNPYSSLTMSVVESDANQKLAIETAMKSFVLLKNNGVLPIKHRINNLALVGPFSDETKNLDGDYAANTPGRYKTDVLDAMKHIANNVHMGKGCDNVKCQNYNSGQVLSQLNNADLIVVALGTGQDNEGEGHDRFSFDLPGHQRQLLGDVLSHANGKPVVALLFTGTAVDMNWAHVDNRMSAIMQCWLPGQATGEALRHVLMNDMAGAVPAGRLPITWMKNENQLGDIYDYSLTERTYRYFTGEPLYPFGYGLSYTTFHYSDLSYPHSINAGQDLHGHVTVRNTGQYDADEVVQVYISWQKNWGFDPKIQLAWFDRVWVPKNSQKTVSFTVESKTMALWMDNQWKIVPANMKLYVGGQQPNQARAASSNVLEVTFDVNGSHNTHSLIG